MKKADFKQGVVSQAVVNELNNLGFCTCPTNCDCKSKCTDSNSTGTETVKKMYAESKGE